MFTKVLSLLRSNKKVVKFLLSGVSAAALEYVVFLLVEYLTDSSTAISQALSFCCGLVVSFLLNKYWVFESKISNAYKKELALYLIVGFLNLTLTTLLISFLSFYMAAFIAKIVLMVCVAIWNYFLFNTIIFKSR